MLTFQGEGLELDIQRRRHPMWEWLLSHPIRPEAAFLAEMIAPLAVNPVYLTAPFFWMFLLGQVFSIGQAILGGIAIGLVVAFAAACLNKTIELCAMLRLSVRSRGALLGFLSWLGYAALLIPLFTFGKPAIVATAAGWLYPVSQWLHPPWLAWMLGIWGSAGPSLGNAILTGCAFGGLLLAGCVALSSWGTKKGLEGGFDSITRAPRMLDLAQRPRFGRDPLYRKELLWFWRDRGAVVQAVLIPLTVAAMQAFNLRQVVEAAGHQWNSLCALAIICGTYFLIILGPRSLASEGPALWMALTWPRGLEDLLKAKARLWWFLSSAIVGAVLIFVVTRFPADSWKVALVAAGWWFFGRSLAEKSVTLVNAPSSSGEAEPVSRSRQWTAMLGTLAFGSGVMSQNWHLAIIGIVFSSLTAAAMWQNLRARLPFLYDPWSEKFPTPPTLMHAMIAIACMVEGVAVLSALVLGFGGPDKLFIGQAIAYGAGAAVTFVIMHRFLARRGVSFRTIWNWPPEGETSSKIARWFRQVGMAGSWRAAGAGAVAGVVLGLLAILYGLVLQQIPDIAKVLHQHAEVLRNAQGARLFLALMAVVFAPVAEEYLFRGMLYRALDREWGGWRALVGSAVFFAIYHPPLSWVPVFCVGFVNAWLFKHTGRLAPCVCCHMVYNAIVVFTT
jgi:membrane protease YdiL (CAAX protease family)